MQTEPMREKTFNIRMSDEESQRVEAVARHYGLNAAGVIRMLVKKEADAIGFKFDAPKPTKKGAKK